MFKVRGQERGDVKKKAEHEKRTVFGARFVFERQEERDEPLGHPQMPNTPVWACFASVDDGNKAEHEKRADNGTFFVFEGRGQVVHVKMYPGT